MSLSDNPHHCTLLMRDRSSVHSILSSLNSMMDEVSEIRNRLKTQQDSADEGLRVGMCSSCVYCLPRC
jgi:hypothetical protein